MHLDMPTPHDIEHLAAARDPLSATLYVPTTPGGIDADSNRLAARGLWEPVLLEMYGRADKRDVWPIEEMMNTLLDDDEFWEHLGRSLAIFVSSKGIVEFRLPNSLESYATLADRFTITPLLRATTFPNDAYTLALSQNGARLIEISADESPREVTVSDMPRSAEKAVGLRSIGGRSPYGRLHGDEGRKVRLTQYARAVDHAIRPTLNASSLPLVVAATQPLAAIFANLSGYRHVVAAPLRGNPDEMTDAEIAAETRVVLDQLNEASLDELRTTFEERRNSGRAVTDLAELARAATFGQVDTVIIDMNAHVAGHIDIGGALVLDPADDLDVLEEIARAALGTGARVMSVRSDDLPDGVSAAGLLRFATEG